jgi:adenylylsulfate kinase
MIADILMKLFRKDPSVKRHLLKTISWRIVGSIDTMILGWIITGHISTGAKIGGMEMATKMLLYFFHERAWYKIKFGIPSRAIKAQVIKDENANKLFAQTTKISRTEREELNKSKSFTIWLTGLSASGKSTIANELDVWFYEHSLRSYVIDGDNTRLGINSDLSFSNEDRSENIRRVAELCKLFNEAGTIAIASFISPFAADREIAKQIVGRSNIVEVYVDTSIEECRRRDTKGLYLLAENGVIKNFTGVSSPYDPPSNPDVHLYTERATLSESVSTIIETLKQRSLLPSPTYQDALYKTSKI